MERPAKLYLVLAGILALLLVLILAVAAQAMEPGRVGPARHEPAWANPRFGPWWLCADRGLEEARLVHRPALIYFSGRDCPACRRMDRLFVQSRARWIVHRYVLIHLWYEDNQGLALRFRVRGMPTFILLDSAGREMRRHVGAVPEERFYRWAGEPGP